MAFISLIAFRILCSIIWNESSACASELQDEVYAPTGDDMSRLFHIELFLLALLFTSIPSLSLAQESKSKSVFNKIGDAVGGTISGIGETVGDIGSSLTGSTSPEEARNKIDEVTQIELNSLLKSNAVARGLYEQSYGYAAFDSRKFSLLFTSGGGAGVVVEKPSGKRTYMNMATAGAGLGAGLQFFQLFIFFEDKASLDGFVNEGWEGNAAATGVFGKNSLEKNARFVEGMAVIQVNQKGIMADANLTGTRYWKSKTLNSNS